MVIITSNGCFAKASRRDSPRWRLVVGPPPYASGFSDLATRRGLLPHPRLRRRGKVAAGFLFVPLLLNVPPPSYPSQLYATREVSILSLPAAVTAEVFTGPKLRRTAADFAAGGCGCDPRRWRFLFLPLLWLTPTVAMAAVLIALADL